MVLELG